MPEENIDYKGMYEGLVKENEQLRARLLYLKARNPWLEVFTWENIKALLLSPYYIVGYIVGVITMTFLWVGYGEKGKP